ncbi:MAG: leucine--tRNA ligase [Chitinophagales bacterium]|nr:leucine--tRNA ligase [Chitinophagales bacterium]
MSTEGKKGNVSSTPSGVGGMEYQFRDIEKKWQEEWKIANAYKVGNDFSKPKYYVLDMFPYPSGAGLHVGHPLGYIASDIYSRYKRLKGFNVLHPMGFDSFGLPAEQYALDTGQHPAETTKKNIATFKSQLDNIGFCYDWSREVQTSDPNYYKWTQWIFLQLFNSYYDKKENKAKPITELVKKFETEGSQSMDFTADEWKAFHEAQQQSILMDHRLAFSKYGEVNWCEALGTVLANDEVVNGVSERGGFPVEKKKMRQWYLRITAYADRLLEGLETVDFSDSMKEMQRNWIGKSQGAEIDFRIRIGEAEESKEIIYQDQSVVVEYTGATESESEEVLTVYTTRPDTIFGVDFMVVAPEHELVAEITTPEQKEAIDQYLHYVKSRSDRERQSEVKQITGCFTGSYAINPFDGRRIPIWIAEYVLAGYGTGAIMAVPCGDQRDFAFAQHFNIPITNIIGEHFNGEEANPTKEATLQNSGFLNGLLMKDAIGVAINKIEELGIGKRQVNYKMRDAGFSRQRYWGEPFPIVWKNGIAYPLDEKELPLQLPHVESYKPGPEGQGPLANIPDWINQFGAENGGLETSTMPGYAGSSWYFLRYMDPQNAETFCDRKLSDYWNQVDLYIGGTEHAVGHLLYSRMWTKVLFDLGYIGHEEPYKRLVNQGMIQGSSRFVYRVNVDGIERLLYDFLQENFSDYKFITGVFDEPPVFDFRGTYKGKNYFIEISNHRNLQRKAKEYYSKVIEDKDSVSIFISNSEFIKQRSSGNAKKWFEDILNNQKNYLSQSQDNAMLFITKSEAEKWDEGRFDSIHVDVNIVDGVELNIEAFKKWRDEYAEAEFILEDGKYICGSEVEKMSKSKFNTVNPDVLVAKYGADTFRMYEMFLGPVEMSKPWDTKGIEGVHRFLKKLWRLFNDEVKGPVWTTTAPSPAERAGGEAPTDAELKVLHKTIKQIEEATERFSFNTGVSGFMIAVNELTELKCHKKEILEQLLILLTPYAPHIAEELWSQLGNSGSILDATYPKFEAKYVTESSKEYPVSINGKTRTTIDIALDATQEEVEKLVLANEVVKKWIEGKPVKKFIFVKGKMVNVVI